MINARELRIENLVWDGTISQILTVSHAGGLAEKYGATYNWYPQEVDGIPLTQEWLLKLGFGKTAFDSFYIKFFGISKSDETRWGTVLKDDYYSDGKRVTHFTPMAEIQFVHQLQNIFYAVMGTELTIKESATEP